MRYLAQVRERAAPESRFLRRLQDRCRWSIASNQRMPKNPAARGRRRVGETPMLRRDPSRVTYSERAAHIGVRDELASMKSARVTCRACTSFAREYAHRRNRLEVELLDGDLPKARIDQFLRELTPEGVCVRSRRAAMPQLDCRSG